MEKDGDKAQPGREFLCEVHNLTYSFRVTNIFRHEEPDLIFNKDCKDDHARRQCLQDNQGWS